MESPIRVQILNKDVCISLCANPLEKDMNLSFLLPAMDKIGG